MDISKLKAKDREIAELIGEDNLTLLAHKYGGSYIYIPTLSTLERSELLEKIKKRYNGDNAAVLGREYGLSARTIVRIVTKKPMH